MATKSAAIFNQSKLTNDRGFWASKGKDRSSKQILEAQVGVNGWSSNQAGPDICCCDWQWLTSKMGGNEEL